MSEASAPTDGDGVRKKTLRDGKVFITIEVDLPIDRVGEIVDLGFEVRPKSKDQSHRISMMRKALDEIRSLANAADPLDGSGTLINRLEA
jgi:hypothetical protein